jgi:hypothetical protein
MNTPRRMKIFIKYKNLSGDSKIAKFESKKDRITILFADHSIYRYSNQSAGPENISKMKTLALAGKGLGTFIEKNVKDNYQKKIK